MFVTQSDFNLTPYNLENLPEDGTFDDFINAQEELYLRPLLGNLFYDALALGVEDLPDAWEESDEGYAVDDEVSFENKIWKSLIADNTQPVVEGANWEEQVNVSRTRWLVLMNGVNYVYNNKTYKWFGMKKMVVPLIYSLWVSTDTEGKKQPAIENAIVTDNWPDICQAWNKFIDYAAGIHTIGGVSTMVDSFYGYLYSVSASFEDIDLGDDTLVEYLPSNFNNPGRKNIYDF